jgi:hypothetical protein
MILVAPKAAGEPAPDNFAAAMCVLPRVVYRPEFPFAAATICASRWSATQVPALGISRRESRASTADSAPQRRLVLATAGTIAGR